MILTDEVPDEALEAASVVTAGFPTPAYGTYCFACPSRQSVSEDEGVVDRSEHRQAAGAVASAVGLRNGGRIVAFDM